MSAVDEIIGYKRSPDEDFYALLNCDEHSSVSVVLFCVPRKTKCILSNWICSFLDFTQIVMLYGLHVLTVQNNVSERRSRKKTQQTVAYAIIL